MDDTALLVIDVQNEYFPGGGVPLPAIEPAARNVAALLAHFRTRGGPIFHVQHVRPGPQAAVFGAGTKGVEIHPLAAPLPGEAHVVKHFPNSFRDTPLRSLLEACGARTLVICGAMSNMCIDATTRAAADLGFQCVVAHDACAANNLAFGGVAVPAGQVHAAFMAALASAYARVVPTAEVIAPGRTP